MGSFSISGNIVDLIEGKIFPGLIHINNGVIQSIDNARSVDQVYILPGFIDAHVHVESSMVVPSEFARMAVVHGTVATISDPHEIGNVMGLEGVKYMMESGDSGPERTIGEREVSAGPRTSRRRMGSWRSPRS